MKEKKSIPMNQRSALFLRPIPRTLRDQFKAYCARRGIAMIQRLIEHMKEDVRNDKKGLRAITENKKYAIKREPIE